MTRTAYKVVRSSPSVITGTYTSAIERFQSVRYEIGVLALPPKDGNQFLYVFETLPHARSFLKEVCIRPRPVGDEFVILRVTANDASRSAKMADGRTMRCGVDGSLLCRSLMPEAVVN